MAYFLIPALILCVVFDYFQMFCKFKNKIKLESNIQVWELPEYPFCCRLLRNSKLAKKQSWCPTPILLQTGLKFSLCSFQPSNRGPSQKKPPGDVSFTDFQWLCKDQSRQTPLDEHSSFTPDTTNSAWMAAGCLNYPSLKQDSFSREMG